MHGVKLLHIFAKGGKNLDIANRRTRLGLTQLDIAKLLGLERSTVAKWETGQSLPRAELLPKLAGILGCSVDDLLKTKKEEHHGEG